MLRNMKLFEDYYCLISENDQTVMVEEECSEIIKEICKIRRGKGSDEALCEEICDIIACGLSCLAQKGYDFDRAETYIEGKYQRVIDRIANNELA